TLLRRALCLHVRYRRFRDVIFSCMATSPSVLYPLSLHDALPIYRVPEDLLHDRLRLGQGDLGQSYGEAQPQRVGEPAPPRHDCRSEEHTSELQSQSNLVCRLLLEKKNSSVDQPYELVTNSARPRS